MISDRLFLSLDSWLGDPVPHTHSMRAFPTSFLFIGSPSPQYEEEGGSLQGHHEPRSYLPGLPPRHVADALTNMHAKSRTRAKYPSVLFSFICAQPCAQTPGNWDHCMTGTATCLIRVSKVIDSFAHTRGEGGPRSIYSHGGEGNVLHQAA